ncbi:MAG: AzlC family ABC transporter permease [Lachnospiraceae bacterium]|nr:AzlC family ABC transporter permease [Lachnospiraceae bacterium]
MKETNRKLFRSGMRDGIPIGLGYFAVSFTLGIAAKNAGMTALQAAVTSALINASAGEFIGFTLIAAQAGYLEVMVMEAVANARYLLMSCALSQKISPSTGLLHRLLIGFYVTDEIFGVSIAEKGELKPAYSYGVISMAAPGWTLGTFLGVLVGNILPLRLASALSVALYGMFAAVFVPPAKENRIVAALIGVSFAASFFFQKLPLFSGISSGVKIIVLTIVLSLAAALLFPVDRAGEESGKDGISGEAVK